MGERHWPRVAAAVAVVFLVVNVVALAGLWLSLSRAPTNAELRRAADTEVAGRWRMWPSGRIFPDRIPYAVAGETEYASRVGISPSTSCTSAVDPGLRPVLDREGCRAILRATYLDQLQGVVTTVGVAVFPDEQAAFRAKGGLASGPQWLRALPLAGTPAAVFADAARQTGTAERAGPYLVFTTAGQTDGRAASTVPAVRSGVFDAVPELGHTIATSLAERSLPDCRNRAWKC